MLPDERVGGHPQRHLLIGAANLDEDQVRLTRNPPTRIPVHRRLLQCGRRSDLFAKEAWDEVAAEFGDEHTQPGLLDQWNSRTRRVSEGDLATRNLAVDVNGV